VGLTGLFLTCSYRGKEFVRVGYYVNIEYSDPELQGQEPKPNPPIIDKLQRSIMAGAREREREREREACRGAWRCAALCCAIVRVSVAQRCC
jgi:hypothetical protein